MASISKSRLRRYRHRKAISIKEGRLPESPIETKTDKKMHTHRVTHLGAQEKSQPDNERPFKHFANSRWSILCGNQIISSKLMNIITDQIGQVVAPFRRNSLQIRRSVPGSWYFLQNLLQVFLFLTIEETKTYDFLNLLNDSFVHRFEEVFQSLDPGGA
jgi:hypothetical protein